MVDYDPTPHGVPPGSAVITPVAMYQEMRAVHDAVIEMRAEVREIARAVPDHETRLRRLEESSDTTAAQADLIDHETRLRAVERRIWLVAGFAAGGGGAVSAIVTKLLGG